MPERASAALTAVALGKRYRRGWLRRSVWALDGVDLTIPRGGITALIGPNGAGKSTLIRSWVGFERPTSGRALVFGEDLRKNGSAARERVGYVAQAPAIYDDLTINDHITLARRVRPSFNAEAACSRMATLRLRSDAKGRELSGGERAQVALSLVLAAGADVLLLDEPLAHLDPLARQDFLAVVIEAAGHGLTVVLSSHIVSDIEGVCDALVVLGAGRVLLHASIRDALDEHRIVADPIAGDDGHISSLPTKNGQASLIRSEGGVSGRPATLEEVVLGYLGAARTLEGRRSR